MNTTATTTYTIRDSATMLRRNLRHIRRYPSLSIMLVAQPLVFLLLFVYVFGGPWAPADRGMGAAETEATTWSSSPRASC